MTQTAADADAILRDAIYSGPLDLTEPLPGEELKSREESMRVHPSTVGQPINKWDVYRAEVARRRNFPCR